MTELASCWAVVPAAGVGRRMGADIPKQYLSLAGKTVLDTTLERLLQHPAVAGIVVAVSDSDEWWPESVFATHEKVIQTTGGRERPDSVLNALQRLEREVDSTTRVLVHDAARPCVRLDDIDKLIDLAFDTDDGGLLGMPVRDTMKRTSVSNQVDNTVERKQLWHAFTPQLFRLDLLNHQLKRALEKGLAVTDEASAMELGGYKPLMVEGMADNLKITRPEDLALAEYYLKNQL